MISNCHLLSKFYKYLFPTATFRFEIELKNIKFDEFIDILPNDMIIASIERGCTLVTIAFITLEITKEENTIFFNEINQIYEKLNLSNGHHIAGKVSSKPEVHFPRDFNIINDLNGQLARNIIFEKDFLIGDDYKSIKKSIKKFIDRKKKEDWKLIFDHFELFQEAEEEIRNNIENNEFEMTVIDQTIIPSNYFQNYEKIKKNILKILKKISINDSEKFELFLYHGTKFSNHRKIIEEHFENPYSEVQRTDKSYFGKGIYATDNIFYASLYGNNYRQMKANDISSVFCCLSIHNPKYATDIKDDVDEELVAGKPLPEKIINNYGIHRVLVGDKKSYHVIQKEEIIDSNLVAYEFVFPNKYQIIPIFSFKVMRSDFYILWADENGKHIKYSNDLRKNVAENIYYSSGGAAIAEIVERKKKNKIKLIISYENPDSARSIIEGVRDCYGSDIVCLIFSTDEKQIKFAESIENNVIFPIILMMLFDILNCQ
ncbi:hypothetical protein M9Y10_033177 [Tritrichomonas musculus]|uniref:PARP catalytic domain-containing protein n=1 Tax=Tritrichomonas musculus TaxID=1915356 RepID=A0ABR2GY33_9EUKA